MKILQSIIGMMNKEEARHLKLFMGRTNAGSDRKDAELFDYIRKNYPDYDEERIRKRLYGQKDKNALYRLKNRLLDDLGKSFSLQYYDDNDFNQIINNLVLSRLFQQKTQPKIALYYLGKAEKKAQQADAADLLDIIYSEYIRLSQETLELNPAEYIRKRKNNREQLNHLQEIDDILAEVVYKVRSTQKISGQDYRLIETLQQKVNEFSHSKEARSSTPLRVKIYQSVSRILLQKNDFDILEKYLRQTYHEFLQQSLFNRNNHDTKLQMLTYLANATFKNKKYDQSLDYAQKLKEAMSEFGGMLHDKYLFFYYNTLMINYSNKDLDKAIEILHEAKENPVIKKLPIYTVYIYANLTVLNFDKNNFKQAIRNLVKLMMEPGYPNLDRSLRLRLGVGELIIRYELADLDILEHRIEQVKKEFADLLKTKNGKRHLEMIGIVSEMMAVPSVKKDKKLTQKIQRFVSATSSEEANESDIINYNIWLSSKLS